MKKLIVCLVMLCATMAYATNDDVVNSQMYVDNAVGNLQTNLPAKTSEKVVTYTTTAGTTGERDIKTTLGNESTNTSDNGIPTVGTVNTAVDDKQNKLNPLNNVNIVTYDGTYNDDTSGRGFPTTTPIYDSTVNTFDNGLVRAKTLNDAVIAGVNAEATKITTDPKGALWVFNRTPPKVLPTTANVQTRTDAISYCFKNIDKTNFSDTQNNCSSAMFNNMVSGDWGVVFPYNTGISYGTTCTGESCGKEVHGISACIDENIVGYAVPVPLTNTTSIAKLRQSYDTYKSGGTLPNGYQYCYCKMDNPTITGSYWVRVSSYAGSTECARDCAIRCGLHVANRDPFRSSLFGAVPIPVTE